jgi:zinc transport system permease protein
MTFFHALFTSSILQMTLLAAVIASIAGGIVGSYVVVKRISFISGSIAHAVLSGMGLFLWLRRVYDVPVTPIQGALVAAVLAALLIGWVHLRFREREDSLIAAIWAVGMAIGILFISQTPGYNVELMSFLLGSIVWTSPTDLLTLGILDAIVILCALLLHNRLLLLCFDEDQARLQGVPVRSLYLLLLVLVALTVVLLIQVVGIVLVMAMLTLPPMVASLFARKLSGMILLAVAFGALFSIVGTLVSYELDWPVGATITLVAGLAYGSTLLLRRVRA